MNQLVVLWLARGLGDSDGRDCRSGLGGAYVRYGRCWDSHDELRILGNDFKRFFGLVQRRLGLPHRALGMDAAT